MANLSSNSSFIRLFFGRLVTNAGDSIYVIAAMWLIYDITGSSVYTGVAGFLIQMPRSLQFLAGPLVDRWRIRTVLVRSQAIQATGVAIVPLAWWADALTVWLLLAVTPVLSFLNQFVYPAQNVALPQIVDDEDLVRANSLFSTAYQSANTVFNALSGVMIAVLGAVVLFALNVVAFLVAMVAFLGVEIPSDSAEDDSGGDARAADADDAAADGAAGADPDGYVAELRDGVGYLRGSYLLMIVLGTMFSNVALGAAFAVLPEFADSLGGPEMYGVLMGLFAGGSLVGSLGSNLVDDKPYGKVSIVSFCTAGVSLWIALNVQGLLVTSVFFFAAFVPVGVFNVMFFSILQTAIATDYLGRVTSVVGSLSSSMMPVGSLAGGLASGVVGVTTVMNGLAVTFVLLGLYFLVRPDLRGLPSVVQADEASLGLGDH